MKIGLTRIGAYLPEKILTNADLETMVETNDEWIVSRTGIKTRRIASESETTADLATRAATRCLDGDASPEPVIVIASSGTSNCIYPQLASYIAKAIDRPVAMGFDINTACAGFVHGIGIAKALIESGTANRALVTASEKFSQFVDYTDRSTCVLFGDGAASVLVEQSDAVEHEILEVNYGFEAGRGGHEALTMGAIEGPEKNPKGYYFWQDGRVLYKVFVPLVGEILTALMEKYSLTTESTNFHIVPHQANLRMLAAIADDTHIPLDRFVVTIEKYGNTSSSSIGLALADVWDTGRFKKGDLIFLVGFGAGLAYASAVIRW